VFVQTVKQAGYRVFILPSMLPLNAGLAELVQLVQRAVGQGRTDIAVYFPSDNLLCSKAIADLVKCIRLVRERGSQLVLINPGSRTTDSLVKLGLTDVVRCCGSMDSLTEQPAPVRF
jgi:hypothetical protein